MKQKSYENNYIRLFWALYAFYILQFNTNHITPWALRIFLIFLINLKLYHTKNKTNTKSRENNYKCP